MTLDHLTTYLMDISRERYGWLKTASDQVKEWKEEDRLNGIIWANAPSEHRAGRPAGQVPLRGLEQSRPSTFADRGYEG